ncbi:type VI secretion system-associated protein TagF [Burkholderia gladioli]|uniref:type VI secretion system-associated protein TagF n=1 Tax=Burkholderia gladioli TaxID=28095 RepID=UPI00164187F1|nr:type VI secretion system-associated protein TagF [Burkholderia gladioli]
MSGGVGFYGKLPGAGDFVKRRLPVDFIEAWDRHFQRAVETGRRELGERWDEVWRNGPAWRFVLPPQVCGSGAWCGLTGPAVDRLGRAFPMVLAAPCTGDVARILGNSDWFDALERVWRQAQHEAASVETFDARVAVLPRPLAEAGDLSALWRGLPWDSGQWRLDMSGAAAAGVMLTEAWRQLCLRPGPWCLWWTGNATRLFATRGLPRSHAVLLDAPPPGEAASVARMGGIADDIVDAFDVFDAIGAAPGLANAAAAEAWAPTAPAAPAAVAPATIHEDWLDDDATVERVRPAASLPLGLRRAHAEALADGAIGAQAIEAPFAADAGPGTAAPLDADHGAEHGSDSAAIWLDDGRTLVLSADDMPPDGTRRLAARAIREAAAAGAVAPEAIRAALLGVHARLREGGATRENGAALVARFDGATALVQRFGAAAVWHWRQGVLSAPFVERAAGAGGEFDDLLFGEAWLDMPGIGAAGEPDCESVAIRLAPGDRLLLLATRAMTQLPREALAAALALPGCETAREALAAHAGLAGASAGWPLAVVEVQA